VPSDLYKVAVRTHGWGGEPPADDAEAQRRILDAAQRCIDEDGASIGIAEVARSLGVTRPTVYRYYPSTEDLLIAVVVDSTSGFMDRVYERFPAGDGSPAQVVTEAVARVLAQLPRERYLWVMLTSGRASLFSRGVTSPMSLNFGREIVHRLPVAWTEYGIGPADLDELTEHVVRTIQSFMLDPGTPARTGAELRRYLEHWLAPGVRELTARAGATALSPAAQP
jgi:AcrR family transcriptional regulator